MKDIKCNNVKEFEQIIKLFKIKIDNSLNTLKEGDFPVIIFKAIYVKNWLWLNMEEYNHIISDNYIEGKQIIRNKKFDKINEE